VRCFFRQGLFLLKGFVTLAVIGWYSTGVWRLMSAYFDNNFKDHMDEQLLKDPHRLRRLHRDRDQPPQRPLERGATEAPPFESLEVIDVTKLPPLSELDPEEYEIKVVRKRKVKKLSLDLDEEVCTLDHAPSATGDVEGKGGCGPGSP
jgi:hypothetical protein